MTKVVSLAYGIDTADGMQFERTMVGLWHNLPWLRCHHLGILIPSKAEIICCLLQPCFDINDVGFNPYMLMNATTEMSEV